MLGPFLLQPNVNPGFVSFDEIAGSIDVEPPFYSIESSWVDSVMESLSLEEKIAQMIMIPAYSNRGSDHLEELLKLVEKEKVGGVIFFQGGPVHQAKMTNSLQEASDIPLLVAMDAEWGLGMRLDSVISYPRQMMLGAINDHDLLFQMGRDIAEQLKMLGVHMNFAPVADINNNPENPVINSRSFGEDRENVAWKVLAYAGGMQSGNLLVTAKHFPGHGDTEVDSHLGLPVLEFDRNRLDSVELFPFRKAIESGLTGVMVAHLQIPVLDDRENRPATVSEPIVTGLLKDEMEFRGLIVTDAMNMKGVADHFKPGEAEVEAVKAGNDIILMPGDVSKSINHIRRAVNSGEIPVESVEASCRKILLAKAWAGLDTLNKVQTKGLTERLNSRKYTPIREMLVKNALTLARDEDSHVPFKNLESLRLVTINIGIDGPTPFTDQLDLYSESTHLFYPEPELFPDDTTLERLLRQYNTLIVSTYYTRSFGNNFDIPPGVREFVNRINFNGTRIFNHFGYPYSLSALGSLDQFGTVLVSYTNDEMNQRFAAQGLFGGISFKGILPVSTGIGIGAGQGVTTKGEIRLSYGSPESVGMSSDSLLKMEDVIKKALSEKATPGCQLLVARKGQVVWNKAYGYHTYQNRRKVEIGDLYDLASVTKIAATIPSIMKLSDQKLFDVDSTLSTYLPELVNTDKGALNIRDVLTHQAGLKAWIPFYMSTIEPLDTSQQLFSTKFSTIYPYKLGPVAFANRNIVYKDSVFDFEYSSEYPLQVADHLYLRRDYRDSIYQTIQDSELGERNYLYSDLGYYYFYRMVEQIADTLFYPYTWYNFYGPLGARTLGYLPLNRFDRQRIVPTENDIIFRRQLVHGYVHDPGAAMLGGVCGHAGLFSNANDLAKMMQMYLNYGTYGGKRFIDSSTVAEFTRCQFCENENRRGLGFDRPMEEPDSGPASNSASEKSYGHSGFTGTIVWLDPEYDLLYIFLSNRIHPDQYNVKLVTENIRTDIQEIIYHSITDKE